MAWYPRLRGMRSTTTTGSQGASASPTWRRCTDSDPLTSERSAASTRELPHPELQTHFGCVDRRAFGAGALHRSADFSGRRRLPGLESKQAASEVPGGPPPFRHHPRQAGAQRLLDRGQGRIHANACRQGKLAPIRAWPPHESVAALRQPATLARKLLRYIETIGLQPWKSRSPMSLALHYNPNCPDCVRQSARVSRLDWLRAIDLRTAESPLGEICPVILATIV